MRKKWTESDNEKLRELYPITPTKELVTVFDRTYKAIATQAKKLKIKKDPEIFKKAIFTESDIQYMIDNYPHMKTEHIAEKLNCSKYAIYNRAFSMGLKKTPEFLAGPDSGMLTKGTQIGKEFRFVKGHSPANKGKKMDPQLKKKIKHTFFKKGHLPHNTKHDGAITVRHEKNGTPYLYIRLSLAKWELLHRHIWRQHNGSIPKGYNVVFKDGNQANCKIENLELISDAELMKRNSYLNYPEDLQELIRAKGTLQRQINKISENE